MKKRTPGNGSPLFLLDCWKRVNRSEVAVVIRSILTNGTIRFNRTFARPELMGVLSPAREKDFIGLPSGELLVKRSTKIRRALLLSFIAGSALSFSTGCSNQRPSFASMNPFSRSSIETAETEKPSMTESIASATTGAKKQVSAVGVSAKNAFGKSTNAIAGVFRRDSAEDESEISKTDPLRLTDEPAAVGPEVLVANGQLWESTGNFQKAMESYTKALDKTPNDAAALTSVARLHFRQGNHAKATEYFQLAIKQNPGDAALYNDLGLTLSKGGDHQQAAQMIAKSLELAPGTSRYANNLASVLFESGNNPAALKVLQENNKPAVAQFNMAYLHYSKGQMNEARTYLTETIKLDAKGAEDAAVRKAVDRSREMLAQIDASGVKAGTQNIAAQLPAATNPAATKPVATQPVASVAAKPPATTANVSASGSSTPAASVSYRPPATSWAPATGAITLPPAAAPTATPPASLASEAATATPTAPTSAAAWSTTPGAASATATKPIQPASTPAAGAPQESAKAPAFELPHGFAFPESS